MDEIGINNKRNVSEEYNHYNVGIDDPGPLSYDVPLRFSGVPNHTSHATELFFHQGREYGILSLQMESSVYIPYNVFLIVHCWMCTVSKHDGENKRNG